MAAQFWISDSGKQCNSELEALEADEIYWRQLWLSVHQKLQPYDRFRATIAAWKAGVSAGNTIEGNYPKAAPVEGRGWGNDNSGSPSSHP